MKIQNPALLAGAGISADAPANLPCASDFLTALLQQLAPSPNVARDLHQYLGHFLRFDSLMTHLATWFDPEFKLLDYFSTMTIPNDLHRGVSQLLAQHVPVITTNFDNGIEVACREINQPPALVYERAGCQRYLEGALQSSPVLLKMHGSFRDLDGNNVRDTVRSTLGRIGRNTGAFGLVPEFRRAFKQILQQHDLVVAGYSGMSDFDVAEMLCTAESSRQLVWIRHVYDHEFSGEVRVLGWDEIERRFRSCLSGGKGVPRDVQMLYELGHFDRRPKEQLGLILAPTRPALAKLFPRNFRASLPPPSRMTTNKLKNYTKEWAKKTGVTRPERWHFCGLLFDEVNDLPNASYCYGISRSWTEPKRGFDMARACAHKQLKIFTKQDDLKSAAEIATLLEKNRREETAGDRAQRCEALARYYDAKEEPAKAGRYYRQAFAAARRAGDHFLLASIALRVGEKYYNRGRNQAALRWMMHAFEHSHKAPHLRKTAEILYALAYVYELDGAFEKTAATFADVERLYLLLHDLAGEIGAVVAQIEVTQASVPEAVVQARIKRGEYIVALMHNQYCRGMLHKAIAAWRLRRKDFKLAQQALDKAEVDLKLAGPRQSQMTALMLRGLLAFEQNELDRAEGIFYKALLQSREIADWRFRPDILFKLAEIALSHSDFTIALQWSEQALKASRRSSAPITEIDCLRLRGEIYMQLKDREAMQSEIAAAIALAEKFNSPTPLARVYRDAAVCFGVAGDWPRAGKHAETAVRLLQQTSQADEAVAAAMRTAPILLKQWNESQRLAFLNDLKVAGEISDRETLQWLEKIFAAP